MKTTFLIIIIAVLTVSCNQENYTSSELNTSMDSVSYSLGISVANSVKTQGLENINAQIIGQAFSDVYQGKELIISEEEANLFLQEYFQELSNKSLEANNQAGQKFLEENAKRDEVITTSSGLQYEILLKGEGESPKITDNVTVHYHGTLIDGQVFDSSVNRGEPATFPVNRVIQGWTEALQLMKPGSKYKLFIPSELAYGERGAGQMIGPNSTLIFEVQLLSID